MRPRLGIPSSALLLVALSLSCGMTAPQPSVPKGPGFTVLKSHHGAIVIWNEAPAFFTLEIPGNRFAPSPETLPGASFIVDGRVIQVFTVRISYFSDGPSCAKEPLDCYKRWELAYRRSQFGKALVAADLPSPADGFANWEIDVAQATDKPSNVIKQIYATRVIEHLVLVVSYSLTRAESRNAADECLASIATSLKVQSKRIDVDHMRRELANGDA